MANINAALGISQVDLLKQRLKAKRKLYNFYKNILKDFSELKLIKEPKD